jgi:hypothetical protein
MGNVQHYDVTVDQARMNWQQAGPLFERYVVTLVGLVDRRWVDCYGKIVKERPNLARFRLEAGTTSVSFTCRSTDGPTEVMGVLKRLEEMVGLVNETANAAVKAEQESSNVRSHPAAVARPAAASGAVSLAAGLLARFSRR